MDRCLDFRVEVCRLAGGDPEFHATVLIVNSCYSVVTTRVARSKHMGKFDKFRCMGAVEEDNRKDTESTLESPRIRTQLQH